METANLLPVLINYILLLNLVYSFRNFSDIEIDIENNLASANIVSKTRKSKKYSSSSFTSWGESKAQSVDLNSDERLEQLRIAQDLAKIAAEESARKKAKKEAISAEKSSDLVLKLSNQSLVVSKLLEVGGWLPENFITSRELLSKKLLLKVVSVHGKAQQCKEFAAAQLNSTFTSKQGLHSAIVTTDIIVLFLSSNLDVILLKGTNEVDSVI